MKSCSKRPRTLALIMRMRPLAQLFAHLLLIISIVTPQRVSQDVGMLSNDRLDGPGSDTFILLNGLSVTDDDVLGDYEAWVTKFNTGVSAEWLMTAHSGGELIWAVTGVVDSGPFNGEVYTATLTEYTESDCSIDTYGEALGRASSNRSNTCCARVDHADREAEHV